MFKTDIQTYINNFRRRLAPSLKPGIGLTSTVYPADDGGAVLVFKIGVGVENDDVYMEQARSLGRALSGIEQHAFGGNLDGISFGGTNTILEPGRIILIKDRNSSEWSDSAAAKDVLSVLGRHK